MTEGSHDAAWQVRVRRSRFAGDHPGAASVTVRVTVAADAGGYYYYDCSFKFRRRCAAAAATLTAARSVAGDIFAAARPGDVEDDSDGSDGRAGGTDRETAPFGKVFMQGAKSCSRKIGTSV